MFILHVLKNNIEIRQLETLTSGSVNVYTIQFRFNADWKDLEKTVAFTDGIGEPIVTRVDEQGLCTIPWECLQNANKELKVGVQGTKDGTVVLPTIWASLGKIKQGVTLGENTQEPTPEIYNQILATVQEALDKIQEIQANMPEPMTADQLRQILLGEDNSEEENGPGEARARQSNNDQSERTFVNDERMREVWATVLEKLTEKTDKTTLENDYPTTEAMAAAISTALANYMTESQVKSAITSAISQSINLDELWQKCENTFATKQELEDAVLNNGGGGGIYLENIEIITPISKTTYYDEETLEYSELTIQANYSNGLTAEVSGFVVSPTSFTEEDIGTKTITVSYTEAGTTCTTTFDVTVKTRPLYPESLDQCTWKQIQELASRNEFSNYYAVGDTKTITLNNKVSNHNFSNTKVDAFVVGINHNADLEGNNCVHFQIGKNGSNLVAITDTFCGNTVSNASCLQMNGGLNTGGWEQSTMRAYIMQANTSPTGSGVTNYSMLGALPADLRAVMRSVQKYSNNVGYNGNTADAITATTEYLCLPSEYEYLGKAGCSSEYERNKQQQYAYYANGNDARHKNIDDTNLRVPVWTRTPVHTSKTYFAFINAYGSIDGTDSHFSGGIAPLFFV